MTDHAIPEDQARRIVYERAGGRCEMCGAPPTDFAHRKARSQGGRWSPTNALHLCRGCHGFCHGNPETAYLNGWFVRGHEDPASRWVRLSTWLGVGRFMLLDWGGYSVEDLELGPYERG